MKPTASPTAPQPGVASAPPPPSPRVRRHYGVAIVFWSAFVLIFTAIFYLGYLVLLPQREPRENASSDTTFAAADSARRDSPRSDESVKRPEVKASSQRDHIEGQSTKESANVEAQTQTNESGVSVSPFANVFSDDAPADDSAAALRQWRDKLREGLARLDSISERDRQAFCEFAKETLDYVKARESTAKSTELALLAELRSLATRAVNKLEQDKLTNAGRATPLLKNDYFQEPFDETLDHIPPDFMGHDIVAIATVLTKPSNLNAARKSEESDRAYAERLERLASEASTVALTGALTYGSRLAFVLPNFERRGETGADTVQVEYFPQRKSASILKDDFTTDRELYQRLADATRSKRESLPPMRFAPDSFAAPNRRPFAVRYELSRIASAVKLNFYGLALDLDKVKRARRDQAEFRLRVNSLPAKKGEELTKFGRVLCVCTLESGGEPLYGLRVATSRSNEWDQTDYLLTVSNCEFWVYSERTGEIFAKFTSADALNGKARAYEREDGESD